MIRPHAANNNAPLAHDDQLAVARKVRRQQAARMPMDYRPLAIEARQCVETLVGPTSPPPLPLKKKGKCLGVHYTYLETFRPITTCFYIASDQILSTEAFDIEDNN